MKTRLVLSLGTTALLAAGCLPGGSFPQLLAPAATATLPASPTRSLATPTLSPSPAVTLTPLATPTAARTGTPAAAPSPPGRPTASPTALAAATSTPRPGQTPTPGRSPATVNLRTVDWNAVISQEPALLHPQPPDYLAGQGPFIEFKTPGSIPGFADLQGIIYGDISGDGREEAIIPIVSGGTAGTVGFLVYAAGDREPIFATALTGYKLGARVSNGQLIVLEPIYAGWEGNCCPSGISETRYRLVGATLDRLARTESGLPEAIPATVERFYQLISERQLRDAYTFLSPEFQAANPYDRWSAGFANTSEVQAEAALVPGQNAATVNLTVTERTPSGQSTRRFRGRWNLIWSSQARQWLLHEAQISEVR
ncbi:MAG: hypothetical protein K6U89_04420 [Chloroflexi bacterium]|nr:hypothetical protein [Chloroflexota bacterium]GIW09752.1 MAG: hypothetical protein KatS3mg061_0809 [Dehalococcoidia bacterium]